MCTVPNNTAQHNVTESSLVDYSRDGVLGFFAPVLHGVLVHEVVLYSVLCSFLPFNYVNLNHAPEEIPFQTLD